MLIVPQLIRNCRLRVELQHYEGDYVCLQTEKRCAHASERARRGSGAWGVMELTGLLPHVTRALHVDWHEAPRYVRLNTEFQ